MYKMIKLDSIVIIIKVMLDTVLTMSITFLKLYLYNNKFFKILPPSNGYIVIRFISIINKFEYTIKSDFNTIPIIAITKFIAGPAISTINFLVVLFFLYVSNSIQNPAIDISIFLGLSPISIPAVRCPNS